MASNGEKRLSDRLGEVPRVRREEEVIEEEEVEEGAIAEEGNDRTTARYTAIDQDLVTNMSARDEGRVRDRRQRNPRLAESLEEEELDGGSEIGEVLEGDPGGSSSGSSDPQEDFVDFIFPASWLGGSSCPPPGLGSPQLGVVLEIMVFQAMGLYEAGVAIGLVSLWILLEEERMAWLGWIPMWKIRKKGREWLERGRKVVIVGVVSVWYCTASSEGKHLARLRE